MVPESQIKLLLVVVWGVRGPPWWVHRTVSPIFTVTVAGEKAKSMMLTLCIVARAELAGIVNNARLKLKSILWVCCISTPPLIL